MIIVDKNNGKYIDQKLRLKGVKPNAKIDKTLTAEKLIDIVKNNYSIHVEQRNMYRNKKTTQVEWRYMKKVVRSTFSKRLPPENVSDVTDPIGSRAP